jgi:hypothetical protein
LPPSPLRACLTTPVTRKTTKHQMRHRQVDKRLARAGKVLIVFAQAPVPAQPGKGTLHNPALWLDNEPFDVRVTSDYVQHPQVRLVQPLCSQTSISLVSPHDHQAGQEHLRPLQQPSASISILNTSRMHEHHQQQPHSVYQDVALTPFDVLTGIVSDRTLYFVAPPFSAVFTDWLSMTAAEGSGSRHSSTRTLRRSASFMRSNTPASRHSAKYPYTVSQGGRS